MPRNGEIALTDGDEFRIGEYVISVTEDLTISATGPGVARQPFATGGMPNADRLGAADRRGADRLSAGRDAAPDPLGGDPLDDPFGRQPPPGFVHPIAAPPPASRAADPFDLAEEDSHHPAADLATTTCSRA